MSDFYKVRKGPFLGPQDTEPAGSNGMIYYNSVLNKFRKFENGAWSDIGSGDGNNLIPFNITNNQVSPANITGAIVNASETEIFKAEYSISRIYESGGVAPPPPPDLPLSIDDTFASSGFDNTIFASVAQPDGKVIVGGSFISYNGMTANRIIRLNPDGSRDTSFVAGTGFNGTVYALALQPDGKILAGGSFTNYNGTAANLLIRLNTDGSFDTSFSAGTTFDSVSFVRSIIVYLNGKIVAGGSFNSHSSSLS